MVAREEETQGSWNVRLSVLATGRLICDYCVYLATVTVRRETRQLNLWFNLAHDCPIKA